MVMMRMTMVALNLLLLVLRALEATASVPVSDLCDPHRLISTYEYNPYMGDTEFDEEGCARQCKQMSYDCAAVFLDNLCFCGTPPIGMVDSKYRCSTQNVKIDCNKIPYETLGLDAYVGASVPGVVGGKQQINILYKSDNTRVIEVMQDVQLEMLVPPELNWFPVSKPVNDTIDFISTTPGNQDVILRLKQGTDEVMKTAVQVSIERAISTSEIRFECPKYVEVHEYFSCNLSVGSADMVSGKIAWEGQSFQEFTLPRKSFDYVGTPNLYAGASLPDCEFTDVLVTGTQVMHSGDVREVFVTLRKPTQLKILILRPQCPQDRKYDYLSDRCQPLDYLGQSCSANEVYCPLVRGCVDAKVDDYAGANKRGIKLDSPRNNSPLQYKVVYISDVTAETAGQLDFQFQRPLRVEVGDRVGLVSKVNDAVNCTTSSPVAPPDMRSGLFEPVEIKENTILYGLQRLSDKRYLVSVAVAIPTPPMMLMGRFETSGTLRVTATVYVDPAASSSSYSSGSEEREFLRYVKVVEPIEDAILRRFHYTYNKSELVAVDGIPGSENRFVWNFGDGTGDIYSTVPEVRHTFVLMSNLTLTLTVTQPGPNGAQLFEFDIVVYVAVVLGDLMTGAPHGVTVGNLVDFSIDVLAGTEMTYVWSIDGSEMEGTKLFQHTFAISGEYNVSVTVFNAISSASRCKAVRIFSPIVGIALSNPAVVANEDQSLVFTYMDGDPIQGQLTVDGTTSIPIRIYSNSKSIVSGLLRYSSTGRHSAHIALNSSHEQQEQEFDFWVERKPIAFKINLIPSFETNVGEPILLEAHVLGMPTGGTITVTDGIQYHENKAFGHLDVVPETVRFSPAPYSTPGRHTFCGLYKLAEYRFSDCKTILVLGSLGTYAFKAISTMVPVNAPFTMKITRTAGEMSPKLSATIDWGDGSPVMRVASYIEDTPLVHTYTKLGNFGATGYVSQGDHFEALAEIKLDVGHAIDDFGCRLEPSDVVKVNADFQVAVYLRSPEVVSIRVIGDYVTSSAAVIEKVDKKWTLTQNVPAQGYFDYTVHVRNSVFLETCHLVVKAQLPVKSFQITASSVPDAPHGFTKLVAQYTGAAEERANGTQVRVVWEDGTTSIQDFPLLSENISIYHQLRLAGDHKINVYVENNVSVENIVVPVSFYKPLLSATLTMTIDKINVEGYGPSKNCFIIDDTIRFDSVPIDGSIKTTDLLIYHKGTGVTVVNTTYPTTYKQKFRQAGEYEVLARFNNPHNVFILNKIFHVVGTIRGMQLKLLSLEIFPGIPGYVQLSFIGIADSVCVCVELGNGETLAFPSATDPLKCALCPSFPARPRKLVNNTFTIPVTYKKPGVYYMAASVDVNVTTSLKIPVIPASCYPPAIHLENPKFGNPNTPLRVRVDNSITIIARSNGSLCEYFDKMVYIWQLWKLDPSTGERRGAAMDGVIRQKPSKSNLQAYIPQKSLASGDYEVELTIWVAGRASDVFNGVSTFVTVKEASLVVRFTAMGASSVTMQNDIQQLCLAPANFSTNPNLPEAKPEDCIFDWTILCSRYRNETDTAISVCNIPNMPEMATGRFCIPRDLLDFEYTYKFQARATNGSYQGMGSFVIHFIEGATPSMSIVMARPRLAIDGYYDDATCIGQTTDLVLEGVCTGQCDGKTSWSLESQAPGGIQLPIPKSPMQRDKQYDSISTLILTADFLKQLEDELYLRVCFELQMASGTRAETCKNLCLVHPPIMGSCSINATGEITKDTIVSIDCEGNEADTGLVLYRFYQIIGELRFDYATSTQPSYCGKLPYTEENFSLCVAVTDNLGSIDERCYLSLFFKKETEVGVFEKLVGIANATDLEISHFVETGNQNDLSASIQSVSRLLNIANKYVSERNMTQVLSTTADEVMAKVVSLMVDATEGISSNDPNSLLMKVSTLAAVSTNTRNMPQGAQVKLSSVISQTADVFVEISQGSSRVDTISSSEAILGMAMNILTGSNYQIDAPIPSDVVVDPQAMYYDTDIEIPDISGVNLKDQYESLSERNTRENQVEASKALFTDLGKMQRRVASVVAPLLASSDRGISAQNSVAHLAMRKIRRSSANDWLKQFFDGSQSFVRFSGFDKYFDKNENVFAQVMKTRENIYRFADTLDNKVPLASDTVSLNLYKDGEEVSVKDLPGGVTVHIARDDSVVLEPFTSGVEDGSPQYLPEPMVAVDGSLIVQALIQTAFNIPENDVSFSFQVKPESNATKPQYLVVARFITPSDITRDINISEIVWAIVPPSASIYDDVTASPDNLERNMTFFIGSDTFQQYKEAALRSVEGRRLTQNERNNLWVGYRQLSAEEVAHPWTQLPIPYTRRDQIKVPITYRGFQTKCNFLESNFTEWGHEGCVVERETTARVTVCRCNHLTTFAAGWVVAPNKVDFNYIFKNIQFEKNATLYATEISIGIFFLLLFIWARRKDNKDVQKLGITPLAENNPADEYLYEVIVGTGIRRGAGTASTVCMQLNGERSGTAPFTLRDPHRKVLKRGNVDRFLLAAATPMGDLRFLRLWHNNAGKGDEGSWFCDFVSIIDLQTKAKYTFLVEKWFGVDEDDGLVDRVIPVAGTTDRMRFYYLFSRKVKQDASDGHLWASVFIRPAYSRFTRVERVACCLLVLFLTMVSSCMFYKNEGPQIVDFEFSIGPFALTPYVAFTGVVSGLITFVPVSIIIVLFRKSKLRVNHVTLLRGVVEDHLDEDLDDGVYTLTEGRGPGADPPSLPTDQPPQYHSVVDVDSLSIDMGRPPPYDENPEPSLTARRRPRHGDKEGASSYSDNYMTPKEKIMRLAEISLPWQTRILAWILLVGGIGTSAAFTTFYGISFGDAACKQWLSSLFVSFFLDLCLTQPIKVIMFAIFFAVICKSKADEEDYDFAKEDETLMNTLGRRYRLNNGEEYLHDDILRGNLVESFAIRPPDPEALERARIHRQKQHRMHDILRELLFFFIFFTLLVIVSNGFRDPMAMQLRVSLQSLLFPRDDFQKINSMEGIWDWIEGRLLPSMRASRWYNGDPPIGQRGFIGDRMNRIMGYGTIRQLRVSSDSCTVHTQVDKLFKECYGNYQIWNQDEQNYLPGWRALSSPNETAPLEYRYTKAAARGGYPYAGDIAWYSGGGYVHEMRGSAQELLENVRRLRADGWIDYQTRAVIVEFTTYNPGTHLFGVVVILFELPGSGGIVPSYRIEPANLLSFTMSEVKAFELVCQVMFVIALVGVLIKECRNLWRERWQYFCNIRAWAQMLIIFSSLGAIAIYAYVAIEANKLTVIFYSSNGNGYSNFQMVANWNEVLSYLVALITFVAILMVMHILRFNKNIGLLGSVLVYAHKDMKYFFVVFAIIFFSFVVTFFLLFYDTMPAYSTMISSMETSFQIVLGKFDVTGMYEREPILGPGVFATFSLFIIFIMLSMFVAILTDSFGMVRMNPALQNHDHEMVTFMVVSFILWSGLSSRFSWAKRILDEYSIGVTEHIYTDDEEHECEKIISEFNEAVDNFLKCVNRSELAGVRDSTGHQ